MNKTVLLLFFFTVSAARHANAQSSFVFVNYANGLIDAPVFDAHGNRLLGSSYAAMLYGGPTIDSLQPAWDEVVFHNMAPVPFTFTPNGLNGYFDDSGYVQIGNVAPGLLAWLQVRAWDTRLGATYEEVAALGIGGYGASNSFQESGGDPNAGVPTLPEFLSGLQSFSLLPVIPEPSSASLMLVGLPLMLKKCRRRKT